MNKKSSVKNESSAVKNKKKNGFTFIDLFAGIGGFRIALESHGGKCVFSSEWDKKSQETYKNNFGELPSGDITKINEADVPDHDVLTGGFPCQAFSVSGKRKGFEDARGTLFFDVARIAKLKQPKILFLENVKNFAKHDGGNTLKVVLKTLQEIGYDPFCQVLKSSNYGVPQARERIYIIGFRRDLKIKNFEFPEPVNNVIVIKDILEKGVSKFIERDDIQIIKDEKRIIDPRRPLQIGKINKGGQGERIYSIYGAGITLSAYGGGAASKTGAYLINGKVRKLTPRECARVQGFPEWFKIPENKNEAYKQFGDSVSVPVLMQIFGRIIETYPKIIKSKN